MGKVNRALTEPEASAFVKVCPKDPTPCLFSRHVVSFHSQAGGFRNILCRFGSKSRALLWKRLRLRIRSSNYEQLRAFWCDPG